MQDQMLIIEHKMKTLNGVYANACFVAIFGAYAVWTQQQQHTQKRLIKIVDWFVG